MSTSTRPLETGWRPDTPVDDSLLRQFLFNQAATNRWLAEARGGRVHETPDVTVAIAGDVSMYLNQALLRRPVLSDADPVLDQLDGLYAAAGVTGLVVSLWPTPDLGARGWEVVGHPMLLARQPGLTPPGPASACEVSVVEDEAGLRAFEQVMVQGYPVAPAGDGRPTFAARLAGGPVRFRLARVDGVPVAAAASHAAHGVVNLCMAATLPAARRLGAWRALVAARLGDAPRLPAVAFTSDDSRPGFLRMGFLPILRLTLWAVPG